MFNRFQIQSQPWLVIGNFNEIMDSHEKWGGDSPAHQRLILFKEFLRGRQLRDLHFNGPEFAWLVSRHNRVYIKERLDRALGNLAWCSNQSQSQLFHIPKLGSDHRPILLDIIPCESRKKRLFLFEQLWLSHEDYKDLIHNNWMWDHSKLAMSVWNSNLLCCEKALKAWSEEKFLNPSLQVNDLLADIEKLYQSNLPDALQQINCLTSQITKLWTQDEMYQHQRSRIDWLKLGDQNSSFFHHTTLQRLQFNKILRVQDDNGIQLEFEKDISNQFQNYFQELYTSNSPQQWEKVLDFVDCSVSSEMTNS